MSGTLIIVESPAKCKKIESFLGPGYKCLASYGHIRELPNLKCIGPPPRYKLSFRLISAKASSHIPKLKKAAASAASVILATDDDREGEAIAWHLKETLGLPASVSRAVFREITKEAICAAIRSPRCIDMNKVRAQWARQTMDLMVGFRISPVLWAGIKRPGGKGGSSLSAGRCQTPALRLVHDADQEVKASPGELVYKTTGYFTKAALLGSLSQDFKAADEASHFLRDNVSHTHTIERLTTNQSTSEPPAPLTTSVLQQHANTVLSSPPKETMQTCQRLYEQGLITYMRTDSTAYSSTFIREASSVICKEYGEDKLHPRVDRLAGREGGGMSQEAHEAVRPTKASLTSLGDTYSVREKRMYRLIWMRSIESCMSAASLDNIRCIVSAPGERHYVISGQKVLFDGWKAVQGTGGQVYVRNETAYNRLSCLEKGKAMPLIEADSIACLSKKKGHQTEANLVRQLESKGIGRPSTYASIIAKIQERGYVKVGNVPGRVIDCVDLHLEMQSGEISKKKKRATLGAEKKKLILQPLGQVVHDLLAHDFMPLFEYSYTRRLEAMLDEVSQGTCDWTMCCQRCEAMLDQLLKPWEERLSKGNSRLCVQIDKSHQFIIGKHGPVVRQKLGKKVKFKQVRDGLDMDKLQKGHYKLSEIIVSHHDGYLLGEHEGASVIYKNGPFGGYVEWKGARRSVNSEPKKQYADAQVSSYSEPKIPTLDDVLPMLSNVGPSPGGPIRVLSEEISIRSGPHGDYVMIRSKKRVKSKTKNKPTFVNLSSFTRKYGIDSYRTCEASKILEWLEDQDIVGSKCMATGRRAGAREANTRGESHPSSD